MAAPAEIKAKEIVDKTLDKLAASPSIDLTEASAKEMKPAIIKEMSSVIAYQTNQEPFYQSTVTIGAVITLVTGGYALGYDFLDGSIPTPAEFGPAAGPVVGALIVLWGRWVQKKPLGA